jgi:hypothetical protein
MKDYIEIIFLINKAVEDFSELLKHEYQLPKFDEEKLNNPKISWNLLEVGWNETMFPGDESPGVYFIFGKQQKSNSKSAVYIGKASFNSLIGNRLDRHLNKKGKNERIYVMTDKLNEEFRMEFVTTIPMKNTPFLASALEEFLIDKLQHQNIHLLNSVGKR